MCCSRSRWGSEVAEGAQPSLASFCEESLLATAACRANVTVLGPRTETGEQRIGLHRRIRAVVSVDGSPQHIDSGRGLAAVGKMGGGEIVQLRIV